MSLISVEQLQVAYGGIRAVKGIDLAVNAGELVCLIGANGAGKSSTLRAISGVLPSDPGMVRYDGRDIRVKVATLPDGTRRAKPEFDDLRKVAEETARPLAEIRSEVMSALSANGLNASDAPGK